MDIYLIDNETGDEIYIPVNPPEISIKREKMFETVNIINLGEVDFTTGEKIKEITFASFWPAFYDASYCNTPELPDASAMSDLFNGWKDNDKAVRLIISDTNINVLVTVAQYNTQIRGGEPGDVYYDVSLRTYKEVQVRTVSESTTTEQDIGANRPDQKPIPAEYEVSSGDSLYDIAKSQYGDGERWQEIYDLNKDTIGDDPDSITPGTRLVMP